MNLLSTCRENFQLFLSLFIKFSFISTHFFFANRILIFITILTIHFLTISLRLLLYTACPPHYSFNFYLESACYFVVFPLFFPILIPSFNFTYFWFSSNFLQIKKVKHNNTISMILEKENRRNEKAKQARWI